MTTRDINPYQPPLSDPWELGHPQREALQQVLRPLVWVLCAGLAGVVSLNLAEAMLDSAMASRAGLDGAVAHHRVEVLTMVAVAFKVAELALSAVMLPGFALLWRRGVLRAFPSSFAASVSSTHPRPGSLWIAIGLGQLLALAVSIRTHVSPADVLCHWAGAGLQLMDAILGMAIARWLVLQLRQHDEPLGLTHVAVPSPERQAVEPHDED